MKDVEFYTDSTKKFAITVNFCSNGQKISTNNLLLQIEIINEYEIGNHFLSKIPGITLIKESNVLKQD